MIEQYEKEAMKDLEAFYGTELELTDRGKAWVAGYVQAKLRGQAPMPQIDWSKAPEWANYHAFDKDGVGFWYENLPQKTDKNWIDKGMLDFSGYEIDWTQTLTRRPAAQNQKP